MNILVISDLHLGNGNKSGTFGWDQEDFIAQLEEIRNLYQIDRVILNGDIYELYKYSTREVMEHNKNLIDYFKKNHFIYIKGNHDFINKSGIEYYLIENSNGKKIYIEHGHRTDFLYGTKLGRTITQLNFAVLKRIIRTPLFLKVYFKILKFDEEIDRVPRKYNSYKYLNYALRLLRKYDVVIFGHTHKIETHKTYYLSQKKRYLNCGSCSLGRFQGIVLNTESLKYETIKINYYKEKNSFSDNDTFVMPKTAKDYIPIEYSLS